MSDRQAYGLFDASGLSTRVAGQLIDLQAMPLWLPILLIAPPDWRGRGQHGSWFVLH